MTQQEILEYNKRCAKFIGAKLCKDWQGEDGYEHAMFHHSQWSNKFQDYLQLYSYRYSQLKFDSDWNWIMEVVEAIQKLRATIISHNHCEIHMYEEDSKGIKNISICESANTTKTAAVNAISKFLIWYEQNKTT